MTESTSARFAFTKGDIFGGITAGIVALPLALAFGVQSGMGAEAGLYGAIFLGFFAALLGGTPAQVSGPTGPMTVVTAATIASMTAKVGGVEGAIPALIVTFVLAGIMQVAMGVLRLGTLIRYIPYPVISGFMSGIGVIIILLQLFPAIGQPAPASTLAVATTIGGAVASAHRQAVLLTALTLAIIYLFPRVTKAVPSSLVALMTATVVSLAAGFTVPVIGDIPSGWPPLRLGAFLEVPVPLFGPIIAAAATLAALGSIDSLLTSVIHDNVTRTRHQSNRELIGQGIGNAIGGAFGGLPGAGATMRTLVNIRAGGRGPTSGAMHSVVLLVVLLGAGRYAAYIPKPVLAGILISVGIGILDYRALKHVFKIPRADAAVMIVVLLVTVFSDLLIAVGVGMLMASLLFMKQMSEIVEERTSVTKVSAFREEQRWSDEEIPHDLEHDVLVKHIEGPLFFGFAQAFQEKLAALPEVDYVIIRLERVPFMDQSGLYALEDAILALEQKHVQVLLTGLQPQPADMLRRLRIIPDLVEEKHCFQSFADAVRWVSVALPQPSSSAAQSTETR